MHKLKKKKTPYLTVKIFMYGGRHTVIVLCCLVGHKKLCALASVAAARLRSTTLH